MLLDSKMMLSSNISCFKKIYLLALLLLNVATILVPIQGVENGLLVIDICIITLNTLGVVV